MIPRIVLSIFRSERGAVMVELAMALPLLMLLAFGIADYAQAIQAKNILINMSREGANLASRTTSDPQEIMTALATTADPLKMDRRGGMYITRVEVQGGVARVTEQYRWLGHHMSSSKVWAGCSNWKKGECELPDPFPRASLGVTLGNGEVVYAVEVFYDYQPLIGYVLKSASELYSMAIF